MLIENLTQSFLKHCEIITYSLEWRSQSIELEQEWVLRMWIFHKNIDSIAEHSLLELPIKWSNNHGSEA